MKPGAGKRKGAKFERSVCVDLSKWITKGKRKDLFWRSAMSGGRATINQKKGVKIKQVGDITAVDPLGEKLTSIWYIECKHVASLDLEAFVLKGIGKLRKFWNKARDEAAIHKKDVMIIARQNNTPTMVITQMGYNTYCYPVVTIDHDIQAEIAWFDTMIETPFDR